jgi:hypothetical protein
MRVCARVLVLLLLLAKGPHVHIASMTRRETKGGFGGGWVIELRRASTLTPASRNCWASTGMHVNTFAAQQLLQAGVDGGDLPPSSCQSAGVQRPGPGPGQGARAATSTQAASSDAPRHRHHPAHAMA